MSKMINGKHLAGSAGSVMLLPAKPGTCSECAIAHDPAQPHNATSLFYQYFFYNWHGRFPDWRDAMAHCEEHVKKHWIIELSKLGVDVAAGHLRPGGPGPEGVEKVVGTGGCKNE